MPKPTDDQRLNDAADRERRGMVRTLTDSVPQATGPEARAMRNLIPRLTEGGKRSN